MVKTSTSYFLVQMLQKLGQNPGYLIGGNLEASSPPGLLGTDDYFIIESDEYDSVYFEKYAKFQHYHIEYLFLNALELDHIDIYDSIESIQDQFKQLFSRGNIKQIVVNDSYKGK